MSHFEVCFKEDELGVVPADAVTSHVSLSFVSVPYDKSLTGAFKLNSIEIVSKMVFLTFRSFDSRGLSDAGRKDEGVCTNVREACSLVERDRGTFVARGLRSVPRPAESTTETVEEIEEEGSSLGECCGLPASV